MTQDATEDKSLALRKEAVNKFMTLVDERMKAFKPSSKDAEASERHEECVNAARDFVLNSSHEMVTLLIVDIMDGLTEARRNRNIMLTLLNTLRGQDEQNPGS